MKEEMIDLTRDELIAMNLSYPVLLKFPQWSKRREEFLQQFLILSCNNCRRLNAASWEVHHIKYHKPNLPWEYEDSELELLCSNCHEERHLRQKSKIKDCSLCPEWQELKIRLDLAPSEFYNQYGCLEPVPDSYDQHQLLQAYLMIASQSQLIEEKNQKIDELEYWEKLSWRFFNVNLGDKKFDILERALLEFGGIKRQKIAWGFDDGDAKKKA